MGNIGFLSSFLLLCVWLLLSLLLCVLCLRAWEGWNGNSGNLSLVFLLRVSAFIVHNEGYSGIHYHFHSSGRKSPSFFHGLHGSGSTIFYLLWVVVTSYDLGLTLDL